MRSESSVDCAWAYPSDAIPAVARIKLIVKRSIGLDGTRASRLEISEMVFGSIHKTIFTEPGASRLRHLKSLNILASFCQMNNQTLSYNFVATILGRLHWPMSFRRTYAGFSREGRANVRPNGPRL